MCLEHKSVLFTGLGQREQTPAQTELRSVLSQGLERIYIPLFRWSCFTLHLHLEKRIGMPVILLRSSQIMNGYS